MKDLIWNGTSAWLPVLFPQESGKIMHAGPDSVLGERKRKEGATTAIAMNPVEFFQIGIHYWE